MRIIADLEKAARNIYTGCIGFIGPEPSAQFNVAIRTAVVDRRSKTAEYGTGGGIVWDSAVGDEYTEAILKARVLTEQRPVFFLLETILWTRDGGYYLLEHHLKRLADSAAYFDYPVNIRDIERALRAKSAGFSAEHQRIRLLVDRSGSVEVKSSPFIPEEPNVKLKVKLASEPVHSSDIFLYHKTTYRDVYESARHKCPDYDDVVLWNEKGELTESSNANIVADIDGELCTPPVEAGLLAGVFRASLIEQNKIIERSLPVSDINIFRKVYLINSVRKWREAVLFE